MNIAEKMALDCAVKIDEPHIDKLFFPLKTDKFIIFDTRCKYPDGEYDFYTDVLDLIKDSLKKNGIEVYQIANDKSYKLPCDKCFITINKKQEAYLLSKSLLVVANENYSLYLASALDIKSIGLYSVFDSRNTSPIWNKEKQIIIESLRDNNKPSYNQLKEDPKTINFISPYEVAHKILNTLSIENDLNKYDLIHIGENYNQKIIEVVPDFVSSPDFLKGNSINLRFDLISSMDVNTFKYWVTDKKVNIVTDKDLNVNLLANHRSNILSLTVMVSDNISEKFLLLCKSIGLKIRMFCSDPHRLNHFRFKFLDWQVEKDFNEELTLDKIEKLSKTSKFKSSKILISKGQKFSCKANFLRNKKLDNSEENVVYSKSFEEELEFFKIYNER